MEELEIAELLALLAPAPTAWTAAAAELPALRAATDDLVARAQASAAVRAATLADLEAALAEAGVAPDRAAVAALRARLADA